MITISGKESKEIKKGTKRKVNNNENGKNNDQSVKKTILNDKEADEKDNAEDTKETRCTRYPKCPFGNNCHYFHPKTRCTYWPNCLFTDETCKSIHPQMIPCKFNEACTRADCFYMHPDQQVAFYRFNNMGTFPYSTNKKIVNKPKEVKKKIHFFKFFFTFLIFFENQSLDQSFFYYQLYYCTLHYQH